MAVFAPSDLKKMRVAHGMSAADLAELVNCDSTTITRYETGKIKPNPDTMYMICEACDEVDKWCDWMRTEYPISYGRVHPEIPQMTFEGRLMSVFAEISDVQALQIEAMRDGADGKIDDEGLKVKLLKECTEAIGALQGLANQLRSKGGACDG